MLVEFNTPFRMLLAPDSGGSSGAEVNADNYIGTDEEGNSYYADDNGNVTMIDSEGNAVSENIHDVNPNDPNNTDLGGYTYDTPLDQEFTFDENGNLVDADSGESVDTSSWGNVIGVSDGDGKTVSGYTYNESTGKYENADGRSFTNEQLEQTLHNIYGGDKSAQVANNIAISMGNNLNSKNTKAIEAQLTSGNDTLRQALADNADAIKAGQVNTGTPVMVALLTGTIPVNATQKEVETLGKIQSRIDNGESLSSAFYSEMDAAGYTANAEMNRRLVESALNTAFMVAGPITQALTAARAANKAQNLLSKVQKVYNAVQKGKGTAKQIKNAEKITTFAIERVLAAMDKVNKVAATIDVTQLAAELGLSVAEVNSIIGAAKELDSGGNYYDNLGASNLENYQSRQAARESEESKMAASTPVTTAAPVESRPTGTSSTPESIPDNIVGGGDVRTGSPITGITVEYTPLELPKAKEEEKTSAVDMGFEDESSDDSGSDTLETTTPPSSGVGTDTYSNPNVESGRKGWGLGEEDPNRANYDNDKWNRGMERVSTNVVSDAKVKDFITKTFKNDPVLIKTVRIMKTKS